MFKPIILLICIIAILILCQVIMTIIKRHTGGKIISQKAIVKKIDDSFTGVYNPVRPRNGDASMANKKTIVTFQLEDNSFLTLELNGNQARKLSLNMKGILKTNNISFVSFTCDKT